MVYDCGLSYCKNKLMFTSIGPLQLLGLSLTLKCNISKKKSVNDWFDVKQGCHSGGWCTMHVGNK